MDGHLKSEASLEASGSVLVAVRARPFNEREKAASSGDCLSFQDCR